jgi:hypothetical protein
MEPRFPALSAQSASKTLGASQQADEQAAAGATEQDDDVEASGEVEK